MSRGDGHDDLYGAVGDRIALARKAEGISQGKLASKAGVTRASIVNIEKGRQRPPVHLLWQIAAALNTEAARFVPLRSELAARSAPVQLDAAVVASIEEAAKNDPATKRLLTRFIEKATSTSAESNAPKR